MENYLRYILLVVICQWLSLNTIAADTPSAIPLHDGCRDVENVKWITDANNYSPLNKVLESLGYLPDAESQKYQLPESLLKTLKVRVMQAPGHGILVMNETRSKELLGRYSWMYHANPAYQGPDQAKYRVEIGSQHFDVTVQYLVHERVLDDEDPYLCEVSSSRGWRLE